MNNRCQSILEILNQLILGKEMIIRQALACVLAGGHLLLEDVPGVGKTTLAEGLAGVLGLPAKRIQFTNDMLPADLIGVNIFHAEQGQFVFQPGPLFSAFVLADEINRAPAKLQSALLEAMAEEQVSVDGQTYALPQPFIVAATQNPQDQMGTFPLPESQLDRFMMRLSLGYPNAAHERALYQSGGRQHLLTRLPVVATAEEVCTWRREVRQVAVSAALADYVYRLVAETRNPGRFVLGLSPRAGLAVIEAAKAWAWIEGRHYVVPDDVQAIWGAVANHRLQAVNGHTDHVLAEVLHHVAV